MIATCVRIAASKNSIYPQHCPIKKWQANCIPIETNEPDFPIWISYSRIVSYSLSRHNQFAACATIEIAPFWQPSHEKVCASRKNCPPRLDQLKNEKDGER